MVRSKLSPQADLEAYDKAVNDAQDLLKLTQSDKSLTADPEVSKANKYLTTNLTIIPWTRATPEQLREEQNTKDLSKIESFDDLNDEDKPDFIKSIAGNHFPDLSSMKRDEYDSYDEEMDKVLLQKGQILYFYPAGERTDSAPIIGVNFRTEGDEKKFTVLYWNASQFPNNTNPGPNTNSVYGEDGNKFSLDQLDEAFARTKKLIYGEEVEDTSVLDQEPDENYEYLSEDEMREMGLID
jgi:hypothetical protein